MFDVVQQNTITQMTYTFTSESCYALHDHTVTIDGSRITIVQDSTETTVFNRDFSSGLALKCQGNDLCVGALTMEESFTKTIDQSDPTAYQVIEEKNEANAYVGSETSGDPGIIHRYNLNQCPIELSYDEVTVIIKCPCDSEEGPCGNECYTETKP